MGDLTQARLREVLHYDPETGVWTWLIARHYGSIPAGVAAGNRMSKGYLRIYFNGKYYYLHQLAFLYMDGCRPKKADHRNGIRDDLRWSNLRKASDGQNRFNATYWKTKQIPTKNVYFEDNRYRVRLQVGGRRYSASFKRMDEAIEHSRLMCLTLQKEFSVHNR